MNPNTTYTMFDACSAIYDLLSLVARLDDGITLTTNERDWLKDAEELADDATGK